ncbi:protein abrupt isoform X1 [Neodiprion pinetum]|uniref:Protein abrupt isoform X1 n=1 Tax=Neodiprion lecontei TaxID=441921 RepID=A0A6J0BJT9_NEOLC|nr:protein abrupt isoform X1 [Neodiprion lecontei]XP_046409719.1 protein abrupt-like isoform X1 [Neodiprion fabricii]XP_046466482.1 protein abrupt-like isoform X1 [Neodiprion pinetum]XP_046604263.1 protein abrupt-like isoform X1 [Neodiprion virginianus]
MSEAASPPSQPGISQSYCFKWSDYGSHVPCVVRQLLDENCMVDVTISADGHKIHAHRIVLSACSTLFQEILNQVNEDSPTIILSDVSANDVRSIVDFIYNGEVSIPVDNIGSLLDTAHSLKIRGLMEIDGLDESDTGTSGEDVSEETVESFSELNEAEEQELNTLDQDFESVDNRIEQSNISVTSPKRKRRRDSSKKDYSEDMLMAAINDLKTGHTLVEAATSHGIPRSTLYMRAKALGLHLNASRNEYSAECMKAAINAVLEGSSLQQASEIFSIPKTVLWRRIQKEGCQILGQRTEMKKSYDANKREAAVKALERGENLTKVSLQFQIPKTTLFRDKARLVDEGKLPLSFWKKRKTENEDLKKSRLEQAVTACRGGKMSQAAASMTYHIPKTTIWRRLQQDGKKPNRSVDEEGNQKSEELNDLSDHKEQEPEFAYCEVTSEIPITYIDENGIPEDSVIILTTDDGDELNLEEGTEIIVSSDSTQEYVPCALDIEDSSNYTHSES